MTSSNPFEALQDVLHEPNRMAIVSALAASEDGLRFVDLREKCNLTEGNLSRHLKTLQEAGLARLVKTFVDSRPRTTAHITAEGRKQFIQYLKSLEKVLKEAAKGLKKTTKKEAELPASFGKLSHS